MDGLVARTTKSAAFLLCVGLLLSVWTSDSVDNDVHRRDETSPSILSETARMRAPRLRMVRQWQVPCQASALIAAADDDDVNCESDVTGSACMMLVDVCSWHTVQREERICFCECTSKK